MRPSVCIVLNEREPNKARYADSISQILNTNQIYNERVPVSENIEEILKQRNPKLIIVDYLLGDFSTGLDVISAINASKSEHQARIIFFTDEPSVQVAVEAMRLGAIDYIEIESNNSVARLIERVKDFLANYQDVDKKLNFKSSISIDDLIAQSPKSLKAKRSVNTLISNNKSKVILLHGECGTGLTTWSNAIQSHSSAEIKKTIDLKINTQELSIALGFAKHNISGLKIGHNCSVIVENIEQDDGELFELINTYTDRSANTSNNKYLILTTHDKKCAAKWLRNSTINCIELPKLTERQEDLPAFIQNFLSALKTQSSNKKLKATSSEDIIWLSELEWNGNLRELRSAIDYAYLNNDANFRQLILEAKELWNEQNNNPVRLQVSYYCASLALSKYSNSLRRAASSLAIDTEQLAEIISFHNIK